jgi:hypothetical protein
LPASGGRSERCCNTCCRWRNQQNYSLGDADANGVIANSAKAWV